MSKIKIKQSRKSQKSRFRKKWSTMIYTIRRLKDFYKNNQNQAIKEIPKIKVQTKRRQINQ